MKVVACLHVSSNALPLNDDVYIVSVDTLIDPIDDRSDSSCKINLCLPSVEAIVLDDCTSSCENYIY